MNYHARCNCGKWLSGIEKVIICSDCGQENLMVAEASARQEATAEQSETGPKKSSRGQRLANTEGSIKPRLPNPGAAILRYPKDIEEQRKKELDEIINRLTRVQRR
jgi:hypothetical protein